MNKIVTAAGSLLKRSYVRTIRLVRPLFRSLGVLGYLERQPTRRAKWLRSLFAIYDFDDLASLNLPWWTFDAVDHVESFLSKRRGARVFEWGSGVSTIWLAGLADEVITVEYDADFGALVKDRIGDSDRIAVKIVPPASEGTIASSKPGFEGKYFDEYVAQIDNTKGQFDLVVIDGRAREACLAMVRDKLKPDGIIVFDDTKRRRYADAIGNSSYKAQHMGGLAVFLLTRSATSILRRAGSAAEA